MIRDVKDAILSGLDFYLRHQVVNEYIADCGRFPLLYDTCENSIECLSTNWETGIMIEVLLSAYKYFNNGKYLDSAKYAVEYLKSLQFFVPWNERLHGVFCEITPQTLWAHPRDALTAAWALLDFSQIANNQDTLERSLLYAEWFCKVGIEQGYPYWTVRFDEKSWEPTFCGSFHSGGAFYFGRLYEITGTQKYLDVMLKILDFYNEKHIDSDGRVAVVLDRNTFEVLDNKGLTTRWWEEMHVYNDDFGALANLFAYRITNNNKYSNSARRFLKMMEIVQRDDGGFGPEDYSVPSATGVVVTEALAAKMLGFEFMGDSCVESAINKILSTQICDENSESNGAFLSEDHKANIRTGGYSIMALMRYLGANDPYYYFLS